MWYLIPIGIFLLGFLVGVPAGIFLDVIVPEEDVWRAWRAEG